MRPSRLRRMIQSGKVVTFSKGETFHSLDFNEVLYVVKSGFVKRYSVDDKNNRMIESIYGPNYFFPLSPVFMKLFKLDLNQEFKVYVYQAMTDIELNGIDTTELIKILKEDPELYADLLYETGRRLKVDIDRLTSNSLKDDHKKTIHQLVCLAEEFGDNTHKNSKASIKIQVPLVPLDLAEQINIPESVAAKTFNQLQAQGLIELKQDHIFIPDLELLKDTYLR